MQLQDACRVGGGAEKSRVAERILPAVAAEHIPALTDQGDEQCDDQKIQQDVRGGDERNAGEQRNDERDEAVALHARSPNRPVGRNSSTRMKMTKMPIWPSDSPR